MPDRFGRCQCGGTGADGCPTPEERAAARLQALEDARFTAELTAAVLDDLAVGHPLLRAIQVDLMDGVLTPPVMCERPEILDAIAADAERHDIEPLMLPASTIDPLTHRLETHRASQ